MMIFDKKEQNSPSYKNNGEIRLSSRAVSRGIGIGKIVCLHGQTRQFYRLSIKESQIEREIRRLSAAIRLTKRQLKKIGSHNKEISNEKKKDIFEVHLLILEDDSLISKIENKIKEQKVNAEWAVKIIFDGYISNYKTISDEHLRDRYIDLQDISDRLLNSLGGGGISSVHLKKDSIIVAKEVKPSTLIELNESEPKAIITENGGWTSHTFILARELNLPAVTGMKNFLRRVQTGDDVIVDGYNGEIILNPTKETVKKYKAAAAHFQKTNIPTSVISKENVRTLDGREIIIRANLDLHSLYEKAEKIGAQGIGLYRSEFLFNQYRGYPTEAEQLEAYKNIGKLVGAQSAKIRTFDLSIDQLADEKTEKEKNQALGLRGIRLALSHISEFKTQLRALLQASAEFNIDIVLPMISDVAEIVQVKEILRKEKNYLKRKGISFGNPKIGAMIEVPSAVLTIEEILNEVDFLNLGTNDLVQYLLAVDRDNESVADWFKTLHPAVLRSIEKVLTEAGKKEIPVVVCGEMAGSPFYVPILLGLGAKELSMNVNSILRIRKTISGIAFEEAFEIVNRIKKLQATDEIEEIVRSNFSLNWSHLFSPDSLSLK